MPCVEARLQGAIVIASFCTAIPEAAGEGAVFVTNPKDPRAHLAAMEMAERVRQEGKYAEQEQEQKEAVQSAIPLRSGRSQRSTLPSSEGLHRQGHRHSTDARRRQDVRNGTDMREKTSRTAGRPLHKMAAVPAVPRQHCHGLTA